MSDLFLKLLYEDFSQRLYALRYNDCYIYNEISNCVFLLLFTTLNCKEETRH